MLLLLLIASWAMDEPRVLLVSNRVLARRGFVEELQSCRFNLLVSPMLFPRAVPSSDESCSSLWMEETDQPDELSMLQEGGHVSRCCGVDNHCGR